MILQSLCGEPLYLPVIWQRSLTCRATLLKSHFDIGVLQKICIIFLEHLFLITHLVGCFWIDQHVFLHSIVLIHKLNFFLYFLSQKHQCWWTSFSLFSILQMSLIYTGKFISLKLSLFAKSLSAFVILAGWWFAGFKYLIKDHLKHSLSSAFLILTNPFLVWCNYFDNLMELFPAKGLYFEIWINNPFS